MIPHMGQKIGPKASAHLDFVRAVTAMAVAAGHIRSLFFVDYEALAHPSFLDKILYFFTGLGHQGVIVFFVLSGLLVGGSVLKDIGARTWSWGKYATARLSRLYIVLVPGLLLTWLFDKAGMALTHGGGVYAADPVFGSVVNFPVAAATTFKDLFGTLFFLQGILTRTFGSNTPLWSLANEFWYYAIFPVAAFALLKLKNKRVSGLVLALAAAGMLLFAGWIISVLFLAWLFGVAAVAWALPQGAAGRSKWPVWLSAAAFFAAALYVARFNVLRDGLLEDVILGSAVGVGLWAALSFSRQGEPAERYGKISKKFAGFSYTLYVVHLPFILLMHAVVSSKTGWFAAGRWQPDAPHLLFATMLFALVLVYAYAVAQLTERHTGALRRKLGAWRQRF